MTGIPREMFSKINNERLVLLIRINVFNETCVSFKGVNVLCKRDLSRGITEWIRETRGANAILIGFFVSAHHGITPGTHSVKAIWNTVFQMNEGAGWAALIHEEKHGTVSDIEADAGHGRQTARPFHELEDFHELIGLERVANNTVIDEHGNAGEL